MADTRKMRDIHGGGPHGDGPHGSGAAEGAPKPLRLPGGMEAPALGRPRHHYRVEGALRVVDVKVPDVGHLFSGLDPSPPASKDLDPELDQYIREAVDEIGGPERAKVVFHLPRGQLNRSDPAALSAAVHNFFAYRAWATSRRLRALLRRGYASLAIGLGFLILCLSLRAVIAHGTHPAAEILSEGLLISGWVAMWRPLELFLYDWWPLLRERRFYDSLRRITVEWRGDADDAP